MKVAVTGATGFVGTVTLRALAAAGAEVVPIVRRPVGLAHERVVPRFERELLQSALVGCDAVVHAAAVVHRRDAALADYEALNVHGTRALCEAAHAVGVRRLVLLGSVKVYGEGPFERVTEETPVASNLGYAVTKLEAERIVQAADAGFTDGTCVLRLVPVYGIGDKGNVRAMILNAARGTLVVPGPGRTEKSLVHVSKVAEAISRAVHSTHRGTYLVADPKPPTMRQLADSITRALGRAPVRSVPIAPLVLAARLVDTGLKLLRRRPQDVTGLVQKSQFRTVFDPSKYERTFEHSLHTDLDASVREEVEWLRSIGTIR